jgi:hypothetical protein
MSGLSALFLVKASFSQFWMYCIKNIEYHTTNPKLSLSITPSLALTIEAAESLSCVGENTKPYSMKYHWYQLNFSLNLGYIGTVKVFSRKLIQDGPWVFTGPFISSILHAALVFSWLLLLIIPVRFSLRYPYSHQSWYQSWTTYWSNTYWELPPPSSQNKVNSHMWHLQLSKIVVLSKENLSPLYKLLNQWPWGLSQGLWTSQLAIKPGSA